MALLKRGVAVLAATLMTLAGAAVTAAPAQARACDPNMPANALYLFNNNDFCGAIEGWVLAGLATNTCIYLGSPRPGNWANSVINRSGRAVILSDSINCTGSPSQGIPINGWDTNLGALSGKASSIRVI